jgi:thiamine-phosphate diphosphorylase
MCPRRLGPNELRERLAVYYVADPEQTERDFTALVDAALGGGVTALQLRAKRMDGRDMFALGLWLRDQCEQAGALFFVNDRVDVAIAVGADGVHVGTRDLPLDATRRLVGDGMLIGYSPLTMEEVFAAKPAGADYVGLGPVFATGSKLDAQAPLGLSGLAQQATAANLPSVAIGGVEVATAGDVIRAGVDGVAVISAIQRAVDPRRAAMALANAVSLAKVDRA